MKQDRLSRRAALQGLGVGFGAAAIGCGDDATSSVVPGDSSAANLPAPAASTTASGDMSSPPVPTSPPAPVDPPKLGPKELLAGIEHVVVLMMENRSFDHLLGALATDAAYPSKSIVTGLAGTESNPAPKGDPVPVFKLENLTPADPPHSWEAARDQWNEGKNDGFVKAHAGKSEKEVMGFHDRTQIPLYYWFADNFAVCDHWFSSVMGPTWPNRFYLHATTSMGKKDNSSLIVAPTTIWDALKSSGISAKNYAAGKVAFYIGGFPSKVISNNPIAPINQFFDAAKNGTLPSFSMIDPDFDASDDHPSHNIQRGQAFIASIYKALAESPRWSKTLLVITYDENGGFYDHVPPPQTVDANAEFRQLGFRVPAFVIGPTVKKGYVCNKQLDHVSVAATLKTRWDIASLTTRMDATNDISDCIDSAKVDAPSAPPAGMPVVAMTLQGALYDGVGHSSQPELDDLVRRGIAPSLDTRSHQARIGSWLEHAVRLGAVRIVGT